MTDSPRKKVTIAQLLRMKAEDQRIAALGVYDAPMASVADEIGFEIFVIGNSGPMSLFGYRDSARVRPEDLFYMTRAVSRFTQRGLIVATLPYASYLASRDDGVRTAARFIAEAEADAVQCHGDAHSADNIAAIVHAGIPVLAHLGLRSVRKVEQSGFRVQGRSADDAIHIVEDARCLVDAGVFAIILELVPQEITSYLRRSLPVPILSLGSGPDADGIYQVSADVVAFSTFPAPKAARSFANGRALAEKGVRDFVAAVSNRTYPPPDQERGMTEEEKTKLIAALSGS